MAESTIPMLGEHQSSRDLNTTNPGGYTPDPGEKKALKIVNNWLERAKRHKQPYSEKWLDYYKMFRGRQWKEQRPSYRHSEVINLVFQSIQSVVPIQTDSRPRFEFLPQEPGDAEFAKILDKVAESDWHKYNWLLRLTEQVYESKFYGAGFGGVEFDPEAEYGLGAVDFKRLDPFYCFPDPNAKDVNVDSECWIYAEPKDVRILKRMFPEKAKFIKPDLIDLMQGSKTELDQVRFKSPVDNKTILEGHSTTEVAQKDQALFITCYLKDDEFDEEQKIEKDEATGEEKISYVQKLKYPNGRRIRMAGGIVLDDCANPYDDGKFPAARLLNYILPGEFWGIGEVEQAESPQKIFNKLVSFALDVLTLMGNPIWVVGTDSGVDTDNLVNSPGLIIEKEPNSEVRREPGVELQPYVMALIDRMSHWFDGITGANDVTRGIRPEGITAASAISALQESSQTRLRLQSRNMDAFLQDVGQLYLARVLQFYTAPRIFRLTSDPAAQQFFKFHVEQRPMPDGSMQKVGIVRDYIQNPETGAYSESLDAKEYIIRGNFDVRVSTGSSLPFAKTEKANLAFKLVEAGAIDRRELLKAVDYPNWESVADRMEQAEQQKFAAMAAAKMGGSAGGPPAA